MRETVEEDTITIVATAQIVQFDVLLELLHLLFILGTLKLELKLVTFYLFIQKLLVHEVAFKF